MTEPINLGSEVIASTPGHASGEVTDDLAYPKDAITTHYGPFLGCDSALLVTSGSLNKDNGGANVSVGIYLNATQLRMLIASLQGALHYLETRELP